MHILEANGLQPEILDAADPANSVVKDELSLRRISSSSGVVAHWQVVGGGGSDNSFWLRMMKHIILVGLMNYLMLMKMGNCLSG
jgi:hypothetical protein